MKIFKKVALISILISIFLWASIRPGFTESKNTPFDMVLLINNSTSMQNIDRGSLDSFINEMDPNNRLSIISFGDNVELLHPLRTMNETKKTEAIASLTKLNFSDYFANINEGLELALATLLKRSHEKIVIVLSNGSTESVSSQILLDYQNNKTTIYTISLEENSSSVLKEIAEKTGGQSLKAFNSEELKKTLQSIPIDEAPDVVTPAATTVATTKIIKNASATKTFSNTLFYILIGLIVILSIVMIFIALAYQKLLKSMSLNLKHPKYPVMLAKVKEMAAILSEAGDNLEIFQKEFEEFGLGPRQRNDMLDRYNNLTESLFFLLDGLEREEIKGNVKRVYNQLKQILEDDNIKKIPVRTGQFYNEKYHLEIDQLFSESNPGSILEIAKQGYYQKGKKKRGDVILRKAEVITSKGKDTTINNPSDKENEISNVGKVYVKNHVKD